MKDFIGMCSFTAAVMLRGQKSDVAGVLDALTPGWQNRAVSAAISPNISLNSRELELRSITVEKAKFAVSSPQKLMKHLRTSSSPAEARELMSLARGSADMEFNYPCPQFMNSDRFLAAALIRSYATSLSDQTEREIALELSERIANQGCA